MTAQDVDHERVAFEAFAQSNDFGSYSVERKGEGYWSSHTQLMWLAWKARAEIPKVTGENRYLSRDAL